MSLFMCGTSATFCAQGVTDTLSVHELKEVVLSSNSANHRVSTSRMGAENLELSKLFRVPSLGGENDIIKSITLLPGVRSEGEGGGGYEVRGGNGAQNLILLDGITLYNPTHVMGIFSSFNDNAIGRATLYKGPIPSMYGNAVSSVLDVSLAPGDMETYRGSATLGLLAAKAMIQGPVIKERLSWAVTARRSYVDAFLKMIPEYKSTVMNFYDVTAKIRFCPSSAHHIDGSFIVSRDNMAISDIMGMHWGNLGAALNWTAHASGKVSFSTTLALTHFNPKMSMNVMNVDQELRTYIHDYSFNEKIRWALNAEHGLEFGMRSQLLSVKSAEWTLNNAKEREIRSLWLNAAWIDYSGNFSDRISTIAGVRMSLSSALSQGRFHSFQGSSSQSQEFDPKTYCDFEPRVNLKYNFSDYHNVKLGIGAATQNLHAIRSSSTTFPFDRYALTSALVKPESSVQYGIGYGGMNPSGSFDWSVEGYYRDIYNIYDFKDGLTMFSDIALENIILGGKGRSYGAEFMIRKNSGRLTGWISYAISRTESKIPGINDGEWYDASNDRRHDITITALYKLSDRWSLSGSWVYASGRPLTAPDAKFDISGMTCYYYSRRNAYRTPASHRLDFSATYTRVGKKYTSQWAFGIYNVYCRYNPYVIYFEDDPSKPSGTRAVQQSLFGILPSVSYTIKF